MTARRGAVRQRPRASQHASAHHDAAPASPQVLCANALGPRENATRALWHLSSTPDNQLMIAREGALPALVANLSADSDRAQEFAAAAMESLSRDCPENQVLTRSLPDCPEIAPRTRCSPNTLTRSPRDRPEIAPRPPTPSRDRPEIAPRLDRDWAEIGPHTRWSHRTSQHASAHHDAPTASPQVSLARAGAIAPLVGLLGAESEATQGYADGH
jgi:hypothetical protein